MTDNPKKLQGRFKRRIGHGHDMWGKVTGVIKVEEVLKIIDEFRQDFLRIVYRVNNMDEFLDSLSVDMEVLKKIKRETGRSTDELTLLFWDWFVEEENE